MPLTAKRTGLPQPRGLWCAGIASLLMLSLAVSVATRFVHYYTAFHTISVAQSNSPQQKRQDLEKDALQWAPPALQISMLHLPVTRAELAPVAIPRTQVLFLESLYNRPPPAC